MKKTKKMPLLVLTVVLSGVLFMHGCVKSGDGQDDGICRTCIAKLNGEKVGEIEACSFEEEKNFTTEFNYATVQCY